MRSVLPGGHYGGHWHTPRCLIVILWVGGGGRLGIAMVVVMFMSGVIFTIPLTVVATNSGPLMIIIVVMIIVIVTATRWVVSHVMWISITMVTVADPSPPTSSPVTPPTSGAAMVRSLELLVLLTVVTLLVIDLCSCSQNGAVQSSGYAVVPASCRNVSG